MTHTRPEDPAETARPKTLGPLPIPDPRVATAVRTCNWSPTQYEGTLTDGRVWYLRLKYGWLTLGVGADLDAAVDGSDHGPCRDLEGVYPDRNYLSHEQVVELLPQLLDEMGVVR